MVRTTSGYAVPPSIRSRRRRPGAADRRSLRNYGGGSWRSSNRGQNQGWHIPQLVVLGYCLGEYTDEIAWVIFDTGRVGSTRSSAPRILPSVRVSLSLGEILLRLELVWRGSLPRLLSKRFDQFPRGRVAPTAQGPLSLLARHFQHNS